MRAWGVGGRCAHRASIDQSMRTNKKGCVVVLEQEFATRTGIHIYTSIQYTYTVLCTLCNIATLCIQHSTALKKIVYIAERCSKDASVR